MFVAFQRGFQVIALFSCTQAMKGPSENLQCKNDQSLSVDANPLDLFDQSLLLDMIILGTHQLRGGVNIFFFYKVSFEKHPSEHS